ncbi:MAG: hypothetical protein II680_04115 [Clostridia bacterium]|nr:hypothetical protein [Clostridia bacterium]
MKKKIVLASALWILVAAVWIVGLSWPRWIGTGPDIVRDLPAASDPGAVYVLTPSETTDAGDRSLPPQEEAAETDTPSPDLPASPSEPPSEPSAEPSPDLPAQTAEEPALSAALTEERFPVVLNTNSKKIHLPDCSSVAEMKEKNRKDSDDPASALADGYVWCKSCEKRLGQTEP